MNREIKRLVLLLGAMLVSLLVASTVIQYAQATNLAADPRNVRALYDAYAVERGPIIVGGKAIAVSTPTNDDYRFQRQYTEGPLYAAVTGYLPVQGQATGIEQAMNTDLSGKSGGQFFDKMGRLISGQPPAGASVTLTIDPNLQKAADSALGNYRGSVVVTEPSTGRVLAMVSKPGFDPNQLALHDTAKVDANYQKLVDDKSNPLYNRAIGGAENPPGSVFKLVVASAALESGKYTPDSLFPNPASLTLPGTSVQIYNSGGGTCTAGAEVSMRDALRESCNIPFAELGSQLGADAIRAQAEKFGFNSSVDIPMTTTPSTYPASPNAPQTALSAFGQGDVRATPIQINMVCAAIANRGAVMVPNLVSSVNAPNLSPIQTFSPNTLRQAVSQQTAAELTQMMVNNVQDGAASNASINGVQVAGKTGTAQNGPTDPYTLWFTGFAPADNPKYAITVLIEDGGGMGQSGYGNLLAAPIARKVLETVVHK